MTDSNAPEITYGFFSQHAETLNGSCRYLTDKGEEVKITFITTDPEGSAYTWPDKKCMGIVTKVLRTYGDMMFKK